MAVQPYQQRVVDEQIELAIKLSALSNFLETPMFNKLNEHEQNRMMRQCYDMQRYNNILINRIHEF
jgi:hypothetical protein